MSLEVLVSVRSLGVRNHETWGQQAQNSTSQGKSKITVISLPIPRGNASNLVQYWARFRWWTKSSNTMVRSSVWGRFSKVCFKSVRETPQMNLNTSPTCFEGPRGWKIWFRAPGSENRVSSLHSYRDRPQHCSGTRLNHFGAHVCIFIYTVWRKQTGESFRLCVCMSSLVVSWKVGQNCRCLTLPCSRCHSGFRPFRLRFSKTSATKREKWDQPKPVRPIEAKCNQVRPSCRCGHPLGWTRTHCSTRGYSGRGSPLPGKGVGAVPGVLEPLWRWLAFILNSYRGMTKPKVLGVLACGTDSAGPSGFPMRCSWSNMHELKSMDCCWHPVSPRPAANGGGASGRVPGVASWGLL